jgi:hypothetical protein
MMGSLICRYLGLLSEECIPLPVECHSLVSGTDEWLLAICKDTVETNTKGTNLGLVRVSLSNALQPPPVGFGEGLSIILYD